nr:unnamed protein product [Haemonchus contortus]
MDEQGANLSLSSSSSTTKKPGFDYTNTDQGKRQLEVQERVNRLVLCKQIKILFIPNKEKRPLKELVNKFLNEVVKYDVKQDPSPLKLAEYNRSHKSSIKIVRGKSFQHDDMENLGLYLRQKIRKLYIDRGQQPSEINRFKSPILSVLLGLDYSEWNGTPIRQLLSQSELNSYENGVIKWGSLDIDILLQETIGKIPVVQDSTVQNVQTRKRESSSSNDVINKRARNTPNINIDADVTTIT